MTVTMSQALTASINDMNEMLFHLKKIDVKEYQRVKKEFPLTDPVMDGKRFAAIRKHLKLSQAALGEAIGASVSTISKWECGKNPVLPQAAILMNVLNKHGLAVLR